MLRGMTPRPPDPTALSDQEWAWITPRIPEAQPGGRPEASPTREILHGICSLVRRGGAWRLRPHDVPPWRSV